MYNIQLPEIHDRHHASSDTERRGLVHISEVLPDLLATIPASTHRNTDCCPRPPSDTSHMMPYPGVFADD